MSAINKINVDNVSYNIEDSRVDNIADAIPTASTEQKGLVQVGQGINVDENGVISVEAQESGITELQVQPQAITGTIIGTISWTDENGQSQDVDIYAPTVSYTDSISGTQTLGVINVGDSHYPITYTPAASGDSVQFNSLLASGTQIGTITINGVETAIYAPSGGSGGGSSVSYQDLTSSSDPRIAVGRITIDGAGYDIYVPSNVDWSSIQNAPIRMSNDFGIMTGGALTANGAFSLAEGFNTQADAQASHAEGSFTIASSENQHTQGKYNVEDANGIFADIVGNGADDSNRSNAAALDWRGNQYLSGNVYVGCTDYTTTDVGGGELNTENAGGTQVATLNDLAVWDTGVVSMGVTPDLSSGTKIATITWEDGGNVNTQDIYAPAGGSGGDTVTVTQTVTSGTKIAEIDVSGTTTDIYAPSTSAQVQSDWNIISSSNTAFIKNKPAISKMNDTYPTAVRVGDTSGSQASANYATTIGEQLQADSHHQTVLGRYNVPDSSSRFEFIVGNGNNTNQRQNALALGWGGKLYLSGDAYVNCSDYTGTAEGLTTINCGGTKVATLSDIKADWAITDASASGYIANKPAIKAGTGTNAVIEGDGSTASGTASHAEGTGTIASGPSSHAEGRYTTASYNMSHAEGSGTSAQGFGSHAEGSGTYAVGSASHAEGQQTKALSQHQHAQGKYNVQDTNNVFADIVGNGAQFNESNAEATDWDGNKYLSGGIYVGCTDYTTTASHTLTTLGAGGFRIDMAPVEKEAEVEDPTEPNEVIAEDFVMIDTITKTMGSEMQKDPDTGDMVPVATTVTTAHSRSWITLPGEYTARDLARDAESLDEMEPENWDSYGTYTLQIWGVRRYADDGEGNFTEYCAPVYKWVKTADTTPRDETDPTTPKEPTE